MCSVICNLRWNTTVASTSRSGTRSGMDVSDIAAEALPSVVAITNISVQEVQSYA